MVYGIYRPWMRRPNTTIINNNYMNLPNGCGFGTGGCGGGLSNKAMAWILGITGGASLVGGIFSGLAQNKQARIEQQNQQTLLAEQETKNNTAETLKQLRETYGDKWNVMEQGGEFILQNKEDPSKVICGTTLKSIVDQIAKDSKPTKTEDVGEFEKLTQLVEEQNKRIGELKEQIETLQNDSTPGNVGTENQPGNDNPVTGDTTLPEGYKWGKMGVTGDKYKDQTAEEIAKDVLGENASDEEISAMAEKIKNMNPKAIGSDGKVTNPSRLNVPERTTTATGTPTGTSTPQTENSTASNWKLMTSPGMLSRDAWITAADGNTYKLHCSDGHNLNKDKLDQEGNKILLNEAYKDKGWTKYPIKLTNRNTGEFVEFKLEQSTRRFVLKDSNPTVYLEDYLNNPEK